MVWFLSSVSLPLSSQVTAASEQYSSIAGTLITLMVQDKPEIPPCSSYKRKGIFWGLARIMLQDPLLGEIHSFQTQCSNCAQLDFCFLMDRRWSPMKILEKTQNSQSLKKPPCNGWSRRYLIYYQI